MPSKEGTKYGVAKVCVEITTRTNMVNKLSITPEGRPEMLVDVEFCHVPRKCEKCNVFGHDCENMGGKVKRVWVVKQPRVQDVVSVNSKDKGKVEEVLEVGADSNVQALVVAESVIEEPVLVMDEGCSSEPVPEDDGFKVVTGRKHRVRAHDPTSSAKSPWNLSPSQKKVQLDDKAFPSLSKPVWRMSIEPPQPAKGRGRGKKKK
ncbi:unnamed protein product [Linum trigynum]|uniref:Zinc knuckle CX2CX4HX4C domain-containing protein n=1 Tax=Linum trigynum TaxID=586398 RepID=A0AAV2G7C4_9ROSI